MSGSRKYTEAQKKSAKKWDAANLDRVSIAMPKGQKDTIKAHAEARGESVNGFINRAIDETMERDKAAPVADPQKLETLRRAADSREVFANTGLTPGLPDLAAALRREGQPYGVVAVYGLGPEYFTAYYLDLFKVVTGLIQRRLPAPMALAGTAEGR